MLLRCGFGWIPYTFMLLRHGLGWNLLHIGVLALKFDWNSSKVGALASRSLLEFQRQGRCLIQPRVDPTQEDLPWVTPINNQP